MTAARWCEQARDARLGPEAVPQALTEAKPKALTKRPRLRRRRSADTLLLLVEAASQADDYAPEATTLEDIGFDGDIVHTSEGYTCNVLCNDAAHVGGGSSQPTHYYSPYSASISARPRPEPEPEPRYTQAPPPEARVSHFRSGPESYKPRYPHHFEPNKVTGLIKNREGFRKYLARTMEHPPEPWTEHFRDMWIWFNKPQADGISPNDELRLDLGGSPG